MSNVLIEEELLKCARCGKCRSQCPVFLEVGSELCVARGRIMLLDAYVKGDLPFSNKVKESMMTCLRCLRCQENCPSGVNVDTLLNFAREKMAEELGVPLLGRVIFRCVLPRRRLFNALIRLGSIFQNLLPRSKQNGHLRHLPLLFGGKRRIPNLSKRSALKALPEISKAEDEKKRVAFFVGCLTNYSYARVAKDIVELLNRNGVTVVTPKGQLCCGQPVISYGDIKAANNLALRNIEALNATGCDAIVTGCASCGRMLRKEYEALLGESAAEFGKKVYDVGEYIAKFLTPSFVRRSETVTYHDPCHLNWGQGISSEPRQLLMAAGDYREMANAKRCCGGGGSFSLFHYDLAAKITDHKVGSIADSPAEVVVTSCPGCMLQMQDRLASAGVNKRVEHIAEFLLKSMRQ
jgi:glycolate oxidase iron-sulfur subunit